MIGNNFRLATIFGVLFIFVGLVFLLGNSTPNGDGPPSSPRDDEGVIYSGQSASKVATADVLISVAHGRSEKANISPSNKPISQSFVERFPSGFMAAADQAVMKGDGKTAYELVELLRDCEKMPAEMERQREGLANLQMQGVLKPTDRNLAAAILAKLQRNNAFCQALSGDLKAREGLQNPAHDGRWDSQ